MSNYSTEAIVATADVTPSTPQPLPMREPRYVDTRVGVERFEAARKKVQETATSPSPPEKKSELPTTSESPTAEAPAATEEPKVTLSPQMAALARMEQKQRHRDQELKAREKALQDRLKNVTRLEELEAKLKAGDYTGVKDVIDYDKFTSAVIDASETKTPEQEELAKLRSEVSELKKAQESDVEKRFEAAVNDRRQAVKGLIESKPEYPLIKAKKAEEHVVQHILDTWEHDSIELTPEQAAKEVEAILVEQRKSWLDIPEFKKEEPKIESEKKELPPLKSQAAKTLTNNMQATGDFKRPSKPLHAMTDAERYAEAKRRVQEKTAKEAR